jgi:hypothetical protein
MRLNSGCPRCEGELSSGGDELPYSGGEMDVDTVPDEHDRAVELLVAGGW